jgi:hypothetical protein
VEVDAIAAGSDWRGATGAVEDTGGRCSLVHAANLSEPVPCG